MVSLKRPAGDRSRSPVSTEWRPDWASQVALVVKNPPVNAGDLRDTGSVLGQRRSPGGGHGNPLQYSCLENPMDRAAWWATDLGVTNSRKQLKQLSTHRSNCLWNLQSPWQNENVGSPLLHALKND